MGHLILEVRIGISGCSNHKMKLTLINHVYNKENYIKLELYYILNTLLQTYFIKIHISNYICHDRSNKRHIKDTYLS